MITNTSAKNRITGQVEGIVASVNERGVRLEGESEWRNFSQYGERPDLPSRGQRVRLGLDGSGFVRALEPLEQAAGPTAVVGRERSIVRQACLKAAATFCSGKAVAGAEVTSSDVVKIAAAFERWVLEPTSASAAQEPQAPASS